MRRQNQRCSVNLQWESLEDRFVPSATSLYPHRDIAILHQHVDNDFDDAIAQTPAPNFGSISSLLSTAGKQQGDMASQSSATHSIVVVAVVNTPFGAPLIEWVFLPVSPVKQQIKTKATTSTSEVESSQAVLALNNTNVSNTERLKDSNAAVVVHELTVHRDQVNFTVQRNNSSSETITATGVVQSPAVSIVTGGGISSEIILRPGETNPTPVKADISRPDETAQSDSTRSTTVETLLNPANNTTMSQGLLSEEHGSLLSEMEQALQSLTEPLGLHFDSSEPSLGWIVLGSWLAAAGAAYEYLRRKHQWDRWNVEAWLEGQTLSFQHQP